MIDKQIRRASRMLSLEARRFASDERGSVLALTIAFALPLALFLFVSYNAGIGLLSRMRAQNVADAAAYSASLWHARFLNYCAYTRRHIVANFATIGLCTCYVNSNKMYEHIYDASNLSPTANHDSDNWFPPSVKNQMLATRTALQVAIPVVEYVREGCDIMNGWLSKSQQAMYLAVAVDAGPAIMSKVADDASGKQDTNFSLDATLSHGSLIGAGILDGRKEIPKDEVKAYFDLYTQGWAPNLIAFLGRSKIPVVGGWMGGYFPLPKHNEEQGFIMAINVWCDEVEVTDSRFKTADHVALGTSWYVWFLIWIDTPWGPVPFFIATPIIAEGTDGLEESYYDLKNKFSQVLVYEAKTTGTPKEPSCFAVVNVDEQSAPFFWAMNIKPSDLYPGTPIRAFSRAKAYFRGYSENMSNGRYTRPDLNYPFWGAKLSPIRDGGWLIDGAVTGILGMRAASQYPEY